MEELDRKKALSLKNASIVSLMIIGLSGGLLVIMLAYLLDYP